MSRRTVFGVTGIIFFVFSTLLAGATLGLGIQLTRDGLFDVSRAMKGALPVLQVQATIASHAITLIKLLLVAAIFLFLGRLFFRFRTDLTKALKASEEFGRLSLLFLAAYAIDWIGFFVHLKQASFMDIQNSPSLGMIGLANDPVSHLLIPQFGGASALVIALLFFSAKCISTAYRDEAHRADELENEASLTI